MMSNEKQKQCKGGICTKRKSMPEGKKKKCRQHCVRIVDTEDNVRWVSKDDGLGLGENESDGGDALNSVVLVLLEELQSLWVSDDDEVQAVLVLSCCMSWGVGGCDDREGGVTRRAHLIHFFLRVNVLKDGLILHASQSQLPYSQPVLFSKELSTFHAGSVHTQHWSPMGGGKLNSSTLGVGSRYSSDLWWWWWWWSLLI